ncbi:MAG: hypothetical protein HY795_03535 [Desulfovibrio sp.]|nr:hypothetical protein [Desulfovibrio sp.]
MVIIEDIRRNLDELASHLKGKRIGLYPGDFARFGCDIHLFDGIEVVGVYGAGAGWQSLQFKCFNNIKQFIHTIDVCLFCGLDGAQDLLFELCKYKPRVEVIDLQSSNGEWSLNRPRRSVSTFEWSSADDRRTLDLLGVKNDFIDPLTKNDVLWRDAYPVKGRFTPFDRVIAETGEAAARCPFCGRLCKTRQSLPVLDLALVIFYRFLCCQEFYVLKYIPQVWGVYLPEKEALIDFTSCYPSLEKSWCNGALWHYVDLLKVQAAYCLESLESYCEETSGYDRVSFVGIHPNLGHHGLHELGGVQFCLDQGYHHALDRIMIVSVDLLNFRDLFPEIGTFENLQGQDTKRRRSNAFQYILKNRLTCGFIYYYGQFMNKVAARVVSESKVRHDLSLNKILELSQVSSHWPVLWVTLRSKRGWLGQVDGLASLLNELYLDYQDMLVVFDGLPEEEYLLLQIRAKLNAKIDVHNALHCELYDTIFRVGKCDMFISPLGGGALFTTFIANLPGIYYGSVGFLEQSCLKLEANACQTPPRENYRQSIIIHSVRNYELNWEELLAATKNLLSSIAVDRK